MTITEITFSPGDHLAKMRELAGISSQQMADRLHVSRGTISNYEADRTRPNRATLEVWAGECDADPDLLLALFGWLSATPAHRRRKSLVAA